MDQNKLSKDHILIGVDGGATKVSAWQIKYDTSSNTFMLGKASSQRAYSDIPGYISGFKPIPIPEQLKAQSAFILEGSADEKQQEAVIVEAAALVIEDIVKQIGNPNILVGLGMPGLKTADKRGIAVVANGPRMFHYSDLLESRLKLSNIKFISPIAHLGSDADYCGIGENFSAQGAFSSIQNGYYLGGGTGVADALKLDGCLMPFDQTKEWMAKSWELKSSSGHTLERFASAGGIQNIYAELSGSDLNELNANAIYPVQISEKVAAGDLNAKKTFSLVAEQLALLLYERISTVYCGWQALFTFMNPNRAELNTKHSFRGKVFEKIIFGQRLGELMSTRHGRTNLLNPILRQLDKHLQNSTILDIKAKQHYKNINQIVCISKLREAPALGAGIDAFQIYMRTS